MCLILNIGPVSTTKLLAYSNYDLATACTIHAIYRFMVGYTIPENFDKKLCFLCSHTTKPLYKLVEYDTVKQVTKIFRVNRDMDKLYNYGIFVSIDRDIFNMAIEYYNISEEYYSNSYTLQCYRHKLKEKI